jgi:hypothetical protein
MNKKILVAGGLGVGAGLVYLLTRSGRTGANVNDRESESVTDENETRTSAEGTLDLSASQVKAEPENKIIDDHGTDQVEAAQILKQIRDAGFDASDEKLALALGRPAQEIEAWTSGAGHIDGDVILKARHLALERGIHVG